MKARLFKKGVLHKITTLKRNAVLSTTSNPGAMFTENQITVLNDKNKTFSDVEIKEIRVLINKEMKLC